MVSFPPPEVVRRPIGGFAVLTARHHTGSSVSTLLPYAGWLLALAPADLDSTAIFRKLFQGARLEIRRAFPRNLQKPHPWQGCPEEI